MFHSKRTHPDIKKNTQKFLDHKKESLKRLQALVVLIGDCPRLLHLACCSIDLDASLEFDIYLVYFVFPS